MKRNNQLNRFIICGPSGAGKTFTLNKLKELAEGPAQFHFWDLDHLICNSLDIDDQQLGQWIEQNGLEAFRQQEYDHLKKLAQRDNFIVAIGGSTLSAKTIELLEQNHFQGWWLRISFEECWERISKDANRPMVKLGKEKMAQLYKEREQYYRRFTPIVSLELITRKLKDLGVLPE